MLYFSFRIESELKVGNPPGCNKKLAEPAVTKIVNQNRNKTELYSQLVYCNTCDALMH